VGTRSPWPSVTASDHASQVPKARFSSRGNDGAVSRHVLPPARFSQPYRVSLVVSILLAVGSQAAAIVIAWLTGTGLANAITANSYRELYVIAGAVVLTGAFRALFMSGRRLISGRQALGVEYDMRNALYAKLLRLSFGFYDRHQTGQLLSRATIDLRPSGSSSATD
jgi:ABC-type multidrug transport system fused ATPase/permease subunit